MIENEQQYKITTKLMQKFKDALDSFHGRLTLSRIEQAQLDGVRSMYDELAEDVSAYEIKTGKRAPGAK